MSSFESDNHGSIEIGFPWRRRAASGHRDNVRQQSQETNLARKGWTVYHVSQNEHCTMHHQFILQLRNANFFSMSQAISLLEYRLLTQSSPNFKETPGIRTGPRRFARIDQNLTDSCASVLPSSMISGRTSRRLGHLRSGRDPLTLHWRMDRFKTSQVRAVDDPIL